MDNINVNNLNVAVGGMAANPNKNVDIGLDLLTNEKKKIPEGNTVQKMNYDGASSDSSDLSDGDLDGFDESDDETGTQTNLMENMIEPAALDDDRRLVDPNCCGFSTIPTLAN